MHEVHLCDGRPFVISVDLHLLIESFGEAVSARAWDTARWRGLVAAQVLLEEPDASDQYLASWRQAAADFDRARRPHRSWDVPLLERFPQL